MLTQYRIMLTPQQSCRPDAAWGYRLYAALLSQAPPELGERVHADAITPISQFLTPAGTQLCWSVTAFGAETEQALAPLLEQRAPIYLKRERAVLKPERVAVSRIADVDELFLCAAGSGIHRLDFCTPAAFKSRGQYQCLPTMRLILQSLIKKWNGCFPDCPIEDENGEGLEAMAAGLFCRGHHIQDQPFALKGTTITGFVGHMTLENRLSGFHRELADALLLFAAYAGVGIKTTLGMGGVRHMPVARAKHS